MDFVGGGFAGYKMCFYLEVFACFEECCMCRVR